MAFDIANPVGTGTDAELLEFTRAAIAEVTLHGSSRTIRGRMVTMADLPALRKQVEWLEARINSDSTGSKTNYASKQRAL
jgi:hypothetical protein